MLRLLKHSRKFSTVNSKGWPIEVVKNAAIVTLNSSKTNAMDPKFFSDCSDTIEKLEKDREFDKKVIIFTAKGNIFSSGINIKHVHPLKRNEFTQFLGSLSDCFFKLITLQRPTVSALNGHAIAGGLIFALTSDFRVASKGNYRIALSEVPVVGIPFPAVPYEICRAKLNPRVMVEATFLGKVYTPDTALKADIVDKVVDTEKLVDASIEIFNELPIESHRAYGRTKKAFWHPFMERMQLDSQYRKELDKEFVETRFSTDGDKMFNTIYSSLFK
eukprot:TRINITY_DN3841_c0_g1_i1.p1 TRINITY_DN3841_c0_g1~~TRINITY_DN3841_c0_g1_i1.p1  ORF type:complete len:274 (-),score=34.12 TRINITY_DN3841_c0_g1_i1:70-891(-)